jgi:hypothetical protein
VKTNKGYVCPACGYVYLKNKKQSKIEGIIDKQSNKSFEEINFTYLDDNLVPIDCLDIFIKQKLEPNDDDEIPMYKFFEEYDFEKDD